MLEEAGRLQSKKFIAYSRVDGLFHLVEAEQDALALDRRDTKPVFLHGREEGAVGIDVDELDGTVLGGLVDNEVVGFVVLWQDEQGHKHVKAVPSKIEILNLGIYYREPLAN